MRVLAVVGLVASASVFAPQLAEAGRHDGPEVRDHRRGSDSSSSSSHDAPTVRDHRRDRDNDSGPVVRDHRRDNDSAPVVRDHRGSSGSSDSGSDATYFASSSDVEVIDNSPSSGPFANVQGPTWMFEAGGVAHRFRGPAFSHSGSIETFDGNMASYGLDGGTPSKGDTAAGAFQMRFVVPATEHYYAGVELGIGGLTRTPIRLMSDAADDLHISSQTLVGTNAVFGARARHGIAELDAEMAGGLRFVSMTIQQYGANEEDPSETEVSASGVVEARLRGMLWVAPHVFVAAQAGVGVFERSDVNIGLSIGLSSRPFGQTR
jgi:hypothetical protein